MHILKTIPFLKGDKNSGEVLVTRRDYPDRSVIGVMLRIGKRTLPLPRNKLRQVIEALEEGRSTASLAYEALLEELNEHECTREDQGKSG
jgi:hypothetical protein